MKTGKVWDSTFILDAKLTMVRCFSLFCWAALSSGRLSLLAARSHPPQESRHKIKLGFIFMISSSTPPPNLLLDHCHDCALTLSITAPTFSGRSCASRKQRQEFSMKARHKQTNGMTNYLGGILLVPLVKLNKVLQTFIKHVMCNAHVLQGESGSRGE